MNPLRALTFPGVSADSKKKCNGLYTYADTVQRIAQRIQMFGCSRAHDLVRLANAHRRQTRENPLLTPQRQLLIPQRQLFVMIYHTEGYAG